MKGLSVKQAEKWLQRIRQVDPAAYKDLGKCLKKFDQNSDELECFLKMNQVLFTMPNITQQINCYMQEGNKFVINRGLQQRLNSFLDIARQTKYEIFKEIVEYVNKIANHERQMFNLSDKEATEIFKSGILNIVKDYPILCEEAEKIIPISQQDAIKQLNLKHLKNKTFIVEREDDEANRNLLKKVKKPILNPNQNIVQQRTKQSYRLKNYAPPPSFLTVSEQKNYLKQLQRKIGNAQYKQLIKLLEIYHHNIISRTQFLQLIEPFMGSDALGFKDIIQSRQFDRRKTSNFKPLSDIDFHILPRETHSYVQMPATYPHFAANRTQQLLSILNNKWVSVPRGSEVTFNVRIKNPYELALNKCEDERYEFDLLIGKLKKVSSIFIQIMKQLSEDQNADIYRKLKTAISLGCIQMLYKNATKDQKQIIQDILSKNTYMAVKVLNERVEKMITDLLQHRKFYAIKTWNQVAHKNFYKSLDFKNHEFKNYEKNKMRPQTFIEELNYNVKYLESRGTIKVNDDPFEGKKQFFCILNSFEASSRKQKCISHQNFNPPNYDLKHCKFPTLLPAMILAFQNQEIVTFNSTLIFAFIESLQTNEAEKTRSRTIFKEILSKILKLKALKYGGLNFNFDEQFFFTKVLNGIGHEKTENWINYQYESFNESLMIDQGSKKVPVFNSLNDSNSQYSFQPPKNDNNVIFYASQNFYVFLRYFYALYERILRMKEIASDMRKIKMFQILYFSCIKLKECNKFEDALNTLFGQHAYLFTTFYKIVEGACKSISTIALSPLQNSSFNLMTMKNEEVYLLLLNREMLNIQNNSLRLIRIAYSTDTKLLYIHSFNPFYRFNEQSLKQYNKKRVEISKTVEAYNIQAVDKFDNKIGQKSKNKNNQQYFFFSYSNKLINIPYFEDILIGKRSQKINIDVEVRKIKQMRKKFI